MIVAAGAATGARISARIRVVNPCLSATTFLIVFCVSLLFVHSQTASATSSLNTATLLSCAIAAPFDMREARDRLERGRYGADEDLVLDSADDAGERRR